MKSVLAENELEPLNLLPPPQEWWDFMCVLLTIPDLCGAGIVKLGSMVSAELHPQSNTQFLGKHEAR